MKAVILCAGKGSRTENAQHKILIPVAGRPILLRLCENLVSCGLSIEDITFVVGYNKDILVKMLPPLSTWIENKHWEITGTARSAYLGLKSIVDDDVLLINGDVVTEASCFSSISSARHTCSLVTTAKVGQEEMKYMLKNDGSLCWVAKDIAPDRALGEFCGVSKIVKEDVPKVLKDLEYLPSNDYYDGVFCAVKTYPVFTLGRKYIEIDFKEDLATANLLFGEKLVN